MIDIIMLTMLPLPIFLCFPFNKTLPDIIKFEDSLPVLRIKEIKGHFLSGIQLLK
jgi:hypothetical protein